MTFEVKRIYDSMSSGGSRLTTFSLKYPRFIHCFDEKTEYLSQIHKEIPRFRSLEAIKTLKCKIAQYDKDSEIINFVYPLAVYENEFSGEMVSFEKRKLSLNVTDGHRILTYRRTTDNQFLPYTDIAKNFLGRYTAHHRIPQAGYLDESDRKYDNPTEAALIAWYIADGHLTPSRKAQFHFRKTRKVDTVIGLLSKLDIDFTKRVYDRDIIIEFNPPSWIDHCYNENDEKQYPDILFGMNEVAFAAFQQATLESDGNIDNREINTSSKDIAEQTQVLALLNNVAMNIRCYDSGMYKQKYQETPYVSLRADKDKFSSHNTQNQRVHCFTTPTGYLIVRRNGTAYISGNCEFMTHRMFSRNASSSRAIPAKKIIQQVIDDPAIPVYWGSNKPGMQAGEEIPEKFEAQDYWYAARNEAVKQARKMVELGLHKQIVNRILEPWHHIHVVVTATDWDNFFHLRCHPDAQPEMKHLAELMRDVYYDTGWMTPVRDGDGSSEWHLPFVQWEELIDKETYSLVDLVKISVARCARVSYMNHDGSDPDPIKDIALHDRLFESGHLSPFEHQGYPAKDPRAYSGNFRGWVQYRKTLQNENHAAYEPPTINRRP